MSIQRMKLTDLKVSAAVQPRGDTLCSKTVAEYAEAAKSGAKFPPLIAYEVTDQKHKKPVIVAGFHRYAAYEKAGIDSTDVDLRTGTYAEAWLAGYQSNLTNGLRYTNEQKRNAVSTALMLFRKDSANMVADRLGVSQPFVLKVRAELVKVGKIEAPKTVSTKDGREHPAIIGAPLTVRGAQSSPPENPGIFDGVDEQSDGPEPVNQSENGTNEQSTDEQVKPVDEKSLPSQAWQEIRLEKGDPPVEVVGRITEVKGFPTPRIIRWKNAKGKITEKVFDMTGNPIPDTMGDVFVNNDLRDILVQLETAAEMIDAADEALLKAAAAEIDAVQFAWVDFGTINVAMKKFRDSAIDVIDVVRNGLPFAVCPGCNGNRNGCKECRLTGYWTRFEVESQPKRFRKIEGIAS